MTSPAEKILPKMQATHQELVTLIKGLDQETLNRRPPEGGWSIRENLAHLVDAERAHRRFVEAVLEGRPIRRLEGFDLDRWNEERVARRADQSADELLEALEAERRETLALIAALPDDAWEKEGDHPVLGRVSVQHVLKIIGIHERMHLKEMRQLASIQA